MSDPNLPNAQIPLGYVPIDYAPTKPTSVTVLSIISIVIAALSLICLPLTVLPYFVPSMQQGNPQGVAAIKSNPLLFGWTIGSVALGILMSIYLLISAIGALRLMKWARPAMLAYAVISILLTIVSVVANFVLIFPVTLAPENMPPGTPANAIGIAKTVAYVFTILISAIFMVVPVLILIYFRKPHVVDAFERRMTL